MGAHQQLRARRRLEPDAQPPPADYGSDQAERRRAGIHPQNKDPMFKTELCARWKKTTCPWGAGPRVSLCVRSSLERATELRDPLSDHLVLPGHHCSAGGPPVETGLAHAARLAATALMRLRHGPSRAARAGLHHPPTPAVQTRRLLPRRCKSTQAEATCTDVTSPRPRDWLWSTWCSGSCIASPRLSSAPRGLLEDSHRWAR